MLPTILLSDIINYISIFELHEVYLMFPRETLLSLKQQCPYEQYSFLEEIDLFQNLYFKNHLEIKTDFI